MTGDPRRLRARWVLAGIAWLLWAGVIRMPMLGGQVPHLWDLYPDAWRAATRLQIHLGTVQEVVNAAGLLGFLVSSAVLFISPILVACNHSLEARKRRCRWVGLGLLAMAQISVMLIARRGTFILPAHLLVVSHLILCTAILPWPFEKLPAERAFEVVVPDSPLRD